MKKIISFFILIFVLGSFNKSENIKEHELEIAWSTDRKLVWDDFKGTPDSKIFPNHVAHTNSSIRIKSKTNNPLESEDIFVGAFFNVKDSWVLPEWKNEKLLKHEQIHFDITEIYARRVRKHLYNINFFGLKKEILIDSLIKIKAKYEKRQLAYDEATNHGTIKEIQEKWESMVKTELDLLDFYKSN